MPCFAEPVRPPAQLKSEGATLTRPRAAAPAPAPLPERLRSGAEALGGFSLADVRVHRNSPEPAKLGALAFARGGDIHLGPGQEQHLPHEAWHVVQQKQGRVQATGRIGGIATNSDARLEDEADTMADRVTSRFPSVPEVQSHPAASLRETPQFPTRAIAQRRRVPDQKALNAALPYDDRFHPGRHLPAFQGTARLLSRAWGDLAFQQAGSAPGVISLTPTTLGASLQANVQTQMANLPNPADRLSWINEADLLNKLSASTRETLLQMAEILRQTGAATLGHPEGIGVKADAPSEKANLKVLLDRANDIFDRIEAGNFDVGLTQVFGQRRLGKVKRRYKKGRIALNNIVNAHIAARSSKTYSSKSQRIPTEEGGVFTDRSGYYQEVRKAGEAGTSEKLFLFLGLIQDPSSDTALLTTIHEAVHAGNIDVDDKGYLGTPGFDSLSPRERLGNAAHYEVIPERFLKTTDANTDPASIPASPSSGTTTPVTSLSVKQAAALRGASEKFRKAWTAGMRLHELLISLFLDPTKWGKRHAKRLPYWSGLEGLTIHQRRRDSDSSYAPAFRGVTIIDIGLSEGLVRKVVMGMEGTKNFGPAIAASQDLPSETTDVPLRNRIMSNVLSTYCGSITGSVGRDLCVVLRLAAAEAYNTDEEFLANGGANTFDTEPCPPNED